MSKAKPLTLRVLSYNIHQGLTVYRRQLALSILKEAIKSLKADVVMLQEVAGVQAKNRRESDDIASFQLEALADEIWPYHAYQRNAVFSGGFHGNAILSRFPIKQYRNLDLSQKRMIRRGLLHAEVELPGREQPFHALATHLGLLQYERQRQVREVCQYVAKHIATGAPVVLGGDFNDWREKISPRFARTLKFDEAFLSQDRRHAKTFPARFPVLRLDRIYYRGLNLHRATRVWGRPWLFLSDHLPLVAEFTFN